VNQTLHPPARASKLAVSVALAVGLLTACGTGDLAGGNARGAPQAYRLAGPMPPAQPLGMQRSWMSPAALKTSKLLYVSGAATNTVYVYNYKTRALVGELRGIRQPSGECVDKKGDVWITSWQELTVTEFAHGDSVPIAQLTTPRAMQAGCSIDPVTGNLAVTTAVGTVDVWQNARGTPTNYASQLCPVLWAPGYDRNGNLYVEANAAGAGDFVCELPHGANALRIVSFDQTIFYAASVMWDGKFITFGDQDFKAENVSGIYQATEDGSGNLTLAGSTPLADPCGHNTDVVQPFVVGSKNTPANTIQGTAVIGSNNACLSRLDVWAYPGGGLPSSTLKPPDDVPMGAAVSILRLTR
jgi:hypothetical protein